MAISMRSLIAAGVYWRGVIDRLNQLKDMMEQEVGGLDATAYAEQRESLEEAIRIAKTELESYSTGSVIGQMHNLFDSNMNTFALGMVAAIGSLAAAAAAIAAPGAALVGTSAIVLAVAAPVAVVGGAVAIRYYRRVQRDTHDDLDKRVDQLVKSYHNALDDLTAKERQRLKKYGNQVLTPIFNRLDIRAEHFKGQDTSLQKHLSEITRLREAINAAKEEA